jgi:hypothetical protein
MQELFWWGIKVQQQQPYKIALLPALYGKFNPVIKNSFTKVGADKVWNIIITKYNSIPLVNPDLTDYVTKALNGVLKWLLSRKKILEQIWVLELRCC